MKDLRDEIKALGQTVLVLQGGGALGAYQAGVFQALHEAGVEPDWIIGTSIGAINASLIAGSAPGDRLDKLREFWRRIEHARHVHMPMPFWMGAAYRNFLTVTSGVPGFFTPRPMAFLGQHVALGAEDAGYYSTDPLRRTLTELVDFDRINAGPVRLTVGASSVRTSEMRYFDSRNETLDLRHVMASGALPPAFPAVRVDGELYWDGGILSNTPVEAVFDDMPRRNALVIAVHLWNPAGQEPQSIWDVMHRQKDLQYSSRAATHIHRQRQLHRLRHIIAELAGRLPPDAIGDNRVAELASYGCTTQMHVVRLLAPALDYENHAKDIDFSPEGIAQRWQAGHRDTLKALEKAPWRASHDPMEGFILHEASGGEIVDSAVAAE